MPTQQEKYNHSEKSLEPLEEMDRKMGDKAYQLSGMLKTRSFKKGYIREIYLSVV